MLDAILVWYAWSPETYSRLKLNKKTAVLCNAAYDILQFILYNALNASEIGHNPIPCSVSHAYHDIILYNIIKMN